VIVIIFKDALLIVGTMLLHPVSGSPMFLLFTVMILLPVCLSALQVKLMNNIFEIEESFEVKEGFENLREDDRESLLRNELGSEFY
jgi:hypothetical protein